MDEEEVVNRMQEIVQEYFEEVLLLPCPDFTINYKQQYQCKHEVVAISGLCQNCGKVISGQDEFS